MRVFVREVIMERPRAGGMMDPIEWIVWAGTALFVAVCVGLTVLICWGVWWVVMG